jgi:enolase
VKTTLEMPDPVLRKAKATAAAAGIPLHQFVTEAVEEKLRASIHLAEKPWMKTIGGLKHLHKDNVRVQRIIDEEFGKIDSEDWE